MVWRDERERRKLPGDAERALVLAVKRGLRRYQARDRESQGQRYVLILEGLDRIVHLGVCRESWREPPSHLDSNTEKGVCPSSLSCGKITGH